MSDHDRNTKKEFNLPGYIHTPLFLYQDQRLEKASLLIASFFYSIHTAGQKITASTDYLCALAGIHKRQCYNILSDLEKFKYIERTGFTNRKKTKWIYNPDSILIVEENDVSAPECSSVQQPNTSALHCTKLVHSTALNYCTPVHIDNKENTKDNKKLTTTAEDQKSSSSFFSLKQKAELLKHKLKSDERTDEEFIENCEWHVTKQENEFTKFRRVKGLLKILDDVADAGEHFKASGYYENLKMREFENRIPNEEEFNNWKKGTKGFEWVGIWRSKQQRA